MEDKRSELRSIIKDTRSLPTLPGIITKLNAMSGSKRTSIQEMANVVSSDQVLSAKVLRLANSPSYGFPRISTVSNAMILLGVDVVKSLVISSSIFEIMEQSVVGLWEHSLGAGVAANIIAKQLQLRDVEEISTAALLHDIGKVIIKIKCQDEYSQLIRFAHSRGLWMREAELEHFGAEHAEVGGWLAKSWYLPDKLCEPISCHHDVAKSTEHQVRTAVVHLADVLIKASGFGFSGDNFVPHIQPVAMMRLGLGEDDLERIAVELDDRLVDVKNFSLEIQAADGP